MVRWDVDCNFGEWARCSWWKEVERTVMDGESRHSEASAWGWRELGFGLEVEGDFAGMAG
jgi:hypothetical protein